MWGGKSKVYKFVLWGYGKRGIRFLNICPLQHVIAIIDKMGKPGQEHKGIPVISYEKYKKEYLEWDIVIAVDDNQEIRQKLEMDDIYSYHLLEDCPPEIVGYGGGRWIDELPVEIEEKKKYVIYGLNLYAILLREFLLTHFKLDSVDIIPESREDRYITFSEKYTFISYRKILDEEIVLGATRFLGNKSNVEDVFDFRDKIPQYKNFDLRQFKGIHKNERCFIVATGPSLTIKDLEMLNKNKCICFGVNRIYLSFDETKWRPDYFVVTDDKMIKEYQDDIKKCDVAIKFIGDQVNEFWKEKNTTIYKIHDHILEYFPEIPKFSADIVDGTYSARSVVYPCLQIACYMGFKEIYLLGTDHNYSSNQADSSNHFHKDYYKGAIRPDNYFKEKAELGFVAAKKYAEEQGIKIYNATRGGKLEVFERVDFDTLFE